ncbi:hypothetical protein K493DRAFT_338071 [Basidiobolus meristosporus CBS 931.73]|uniref:SH3 domain-containing protein n=1 Tax=Basidiobolus meristosporus CBS 931.73 TaxID=1314790 RepID=A0A1Y1Y796_9FUNG|nr:hypothetical protein K493DRAFT_338071 [Basidiobolus meristosporus CBS 931.73]|eukprot:ORX93891.1 hypothetical protein K493DRAFT_338071 [Basidiobolus meristosporus CBS 931.73]
MPERTNPCLFAQRAKCIPLAWSKDKNPLRRKPQPVLFGPSAKPTPPHKAYSISQIVNDSIVVPTSDSFSEPTPTVSPEPTSPPATSVEISETFRSASEPTSPPSTSNAVSEPFPPTSENPSDSLNPTFDSTTPEPTSAAESPSDAPTSIPTSPSDVNDTGSPAPTSAPSQSEGLPPTSSEFPPTSEVPPPVSSPTVPPTSEVPPPTSTPPPTSEAPPPTSEVPPPTSTPPPQPTSENPLPTSSTPPPETTPTPPPTSDVPPPTSDVPPPTSDVPPPTSDSIPATSPTTPPVNPTTPGSLSPTSSSGSVDPTLPPVNPDDGKKESGGSNTGAIVGGVVGGIAFIAAIAGFIGYRYYQKKKQFADMNFDFDDIAMSSPPPTTGPTGGARFNAVNSTSPSFSHNSRDFGTGAAIGAGAAAAAGAMVRPQESQRPPSPNDYHSNPRTRQDYTHSQVSSQPSFVSTDAFIASNADHNQRSRYSPERPSNQHHNVAPTPYERPNQYHDSEYSSMPTPSHQDRGDFVAPLPAVRPDSNRLAPGLARDSTLRSSVTSSSAGPGINEADLEETVIVGFDRNQGNRSNTSLSNHSAELNSSGSDHPLFSMTAIEPYMPERPNELLVQPDDELIITEEVGDQWFIGYNRTRNPDVKGYFPRNCVVGGYY